MTDIKPYQINYSVDDVFEMMRQWGQNNKFLDSIKKLIDSEYVSISFDDVDFKKKVWDGSLNVHILKSMTTKQVVNLIVSKAYADEIVMNDDNVISFWWD